MKIFRNIFNFAESLFTVTMTSLIVAFIMIIEWLPLWTPFLLLGTSISLIEKYFYGIKGDWLPIIIMMVMPILFIITKTWAEFDKFWNRFGFR